MSELRYERHPDLRITALEHEGVVLHLGERRYFTVNATGLRLLEELVTPCTLSQLTRALIAEFDVSEESARDTTIVFLSKCVDAAVVRDVAP